MSTNYTNEDELNQMMDNDDNTRSSSYQSQSILTGSSGSSGLNDYVSLAIVAHGLMLIFPHRALSTPTLAPPPRRMTQVKRA